MRVCVRTRMCVSVYVRARVCMVDVRDYLCISLLHNYFCFEIKVTTGMSLFF